MIIIKMTRKNQNQLILKRNQNQLILKILIKQIMMRLENLIRMRIRMTKK